MMVDVGVRYVDVLLDNFVRIFLLIRWRKRGGLLSKAKVMLWWETKVFGVRCMERVTSTQILTKFEIVISTSAKF